MPHPQSEIILVMYKAHNLLLYLMHPTHNLLTYPHIYYTSLQHFKILKMLGILPDQWEFLEKRVQEHDTVWYHLIVCVSVKITFTELFISRSQCNNNRIAS